MATTSGTANVVPFRRPAPRAAERAKRPRVPRAPIENCGRTSGRGEREWNRSTLSNRARPLGVRQSPNRPRPVGVDDVDLRRAKSPRYAERQKTAAVTTEAPGLVERRSQGRRCVRGRRSVPFGSVVRSQRDVPRAAPSRVPGAKVVSVGWRQKAGWGARSSVCRLRRGRSRYCRCTCGSRTTAPKAIHLRRRRAATSARGNVEVPCGRRGAAAASNSPTRPTRPSSQ